MSNGEKISALRKLNNLTQSELGSVLNVSSQAVSKWERNESEPDFDTLTKICKMFGITLDNFVSGNFSAAKIQEQTGQEETAQEEAAAAEEAAPRQLGVCTQCGVTVNNDNLGSFTPKLACKTCQNKKNTEFEKQVEKHIIAREQEKREILKGIIKKSVIASVLPIIFMILGFSALEKGSTLFSELLLTVVIGIWIYAFLYQIMTPDSPVREAVTKFFWICIRMPGIIFEFSLDGFIWLIAIKLLFWAIGIILALIALVLGLMLAFIISFFTFPFVFMDEVARRRI